MMQSLAVVVTLSMVTLFSLIDARSTWYCTPCRTEQECNKEPPEYCLWGEARDDCNRRICAKGPGQRCGGPDRIYGLCAEGMMCTDERCYGCSEKTLQCFPY